MPLSYKQLHSFLKSFLLIEWDPIGVGQEPEAQDEYDTYINGLIQLLADNVSINALADYLYTIETSQMGITSDYAKLLIIAQKLNVIKSKI